MASKPMYAGGEMTRQQFVDKLRDELDRSFPGEQAGFQVSPDDIEAVQESVLKICDDAISEIGGRNPYEL